MSCEKVFPLTVKWKGKSKASKVSLFFSHKKENILFHGSKIKSNYDVMVLFLFF